MKLIIFGFIILLSLQGCSSLVNQAMSRRHIKSCSPDFIYTASSANKKKYEKQCQKDKKIVTEILGEGALEAENQQRGFIGEFTLTWLMFFSYITGN